MNPFETAISPNAYVTLAAQSLRSLCRLAEDDCHEVVEEAEALWGLLAWADGRIDPHERAVFDALAAEARTLGAPEPLPLPAGDLAERPLPAFLRRAAETDGRLAGRLANGLESFGYGLLAADQEIREEEHAALKAYMAWLYARIAEAREAALARDPATS